MDSRAAKKHLAGPVNQQLPRGLQGAGAGRTPRREGGGPCRCCQQCSLGWRNLQQAAACGNQSLAAEFLLLLNTSGSNCLLQACAERAEKDESGEAHCTGQYFGEAARQPRPGQRATMGNGGPLLH